MGRFICLLMIILFFYLCICPFFENIKNNDEDSHINKKKIKCNSEYYWYNKPHYHIMSTGEKINIPDYISWNDWKNYSNETRIQICNQIENRILSTRKNNKEIIKFN